MINGGKPYNRCMVNYDCYCVNCVMPIETERGFKVKFMLQMCGKA